MHLFITGKNFYSFTLWLFRTKPVYQWTVAGVPLLVHVSQFEKPCCIVYSYLSHVKWVIVTTAWFVLRKRWRPDLVVVWECIEQMVSGQPTRDGPSKRGLARANNSSVWKKNTLRNLLKICLNMAIVLLRNFKNDISEAEYYQMKPYILVR
jgi:hypothetical protein